MPSDIFNLQRFVNAQNPGYSAILKELVAGQKRTHWMWFIFPQIAGLGRSEMARQFAIQSLAESAAYLADPVLGVRLRECTTAVNQHSSRTTYQIFSTPDELKFHSCMTLFERVAEPQSVFSAALEVFFEGKRDAGTLKLLTLQAK